MADPPLISPVSDRHLRLALPQSPSSPSALPTIHALVRAIQHSPTSPTPLIRSYTPAYATLLIEIDPLTATLAAAQTWLQSLYDSLESTTQNVPSSRLVHIPACYHPSLAPDLERLAALHHLTLQDFITLHASATYTVAFIGFTPGFPYLTGLPLPLITPRLAAPRPRIPQGSIAIANDQCGIYPAPTPGGWNLIARTPISLFSPQTSSLLNPGDQVKFDPITLEHYNNSNTFPPSSD